MKITAVEPLVLGTSWRNLIFLKVSTDEGLVGYGECTTQNREEGVLGYLPGAVRRHVLGSDPFNIEDLWLRMYRNDFWRGGVIATSVMSGIELACWDIVGKAVGQPVWRLLGGRCHEKIKAYANAWYTVERTPHEFAKRVKVVLEKGYKALKVDPFGPGNDGAFPRGEDSLGGTGGGNPRCGRPGRGNLRRDARPLQRRHRH